MRNPYQTALIVVTTVCGVLAAILYLAAAGGLAPAVNPDPAGQQSLAVAAGSWLDFAGVALLVTLAVAALRWKASESAEEPSDEDHDASVDKPSSLHNS